MTFFCHEIQFELNLLVSQLDFLFEQKLLNQVGGLQIVCIGSLFKSWSLLQDGFLDELDKSLKEFTLVSLNCDSSIGAAFLAANSIGLDLDIHSNKNVNVFFSYRN